MANDLELAETSETELRQREIQLLINVVEPDPEYQPMFVSDEATFLDVCGSDIDEINERLCFYFKAQLSADIKQPLWKFVDAAKKQFPGWPEG